MLIMDENGDITLVVELPKRALIVFGDCMCSTKYMSVSQHISKCTEND